jgi:hypothetical protein
MSSSLPTNGEAGPLELFGHGLPPIPSGHVSFRSWRPAVDGRRALLVGLNDTSFYRDDRIIATISMPVDNEEQDQPIARCSLGGGLPPVWPWILDLYAT